nr:polyprotein [Tolivirales sp.]
MDKSNKKSKKASKPGAKPRQARGPRDHKKDGSQGAAKPASKNNKEARYQPTKAEKDRSLLRRLNFDVDMLKNPTELDVTMVIKYLQDQHAIHPETKSNPSELKEAIIACVQHEVQNSDEARFLRLLLSGSATKLLRMLVPSKEEDSSPKQAAHNEEEEVEDDFFESFFSEQPPSSAQPEDSGPEKPAVSPVRAITIVENVPDKLYSGFTVSRHVTTYWQRRSADERLTDSKKYASENFVFMGVNCTVFRVPQGAPPLRFGSDMTIPNPGFGNQLSLIEAKSHGILSTYRSHYHHGGVSLRGYNYLFKLRALESFSRAEADLRRQHRLTPPNVVHAAACAMVIGGITALKGLGSGPGSVYLFALSGASFGFLLPPLTALVAYSAVSSYLALTLGEWYLRSYLHNRSRWSGLSGKLNLLDAWLGPFSFLLNTHRNFGFASDNQFARVRIAPVADPFVVDRSTSATHKVMMRPFVPVRMEGWSIKSWLAGLLPDLKDSNGRTLYLIPDPESTVWLPGCTPQEIYTNVICVAGPPSAANMASACGRIVSYLKDLSVGANVHVNTINAAYLVAWYWNSSNYFRFNSRGCSHLDEMRSWSELEITTNSNVSTFLMSMIICKFFITFLAPGVRFVPVLGAALVVVPPLTPEHPYVSPASIMGLMKWQMVYCIIGAPILEEYIRDHNWFGKKSRFASVVISTLLIMLGDVGSRGNTPYQMHCFNACLALAGVNLWWRIGIHMYWNFAAIMGSIVYACDWKMLYCSKPLLLSGQVFECAPVMTTLPAETIVYSGTRIAELSGHNTANFYSLYNYLFLHITEWDNWPQLVLVPGASLANLGIPFFLREVRKLMPPVRSPWHPLSILYEAWNSLSKQVTWISGLPEPAVQNGRLTMPSHFDKKKDCENFVYQIGTGHPDFSPVAFDNKLDNQRQALVKRVLHVPPPINGFVMNQFIAWSCRNFDRIFPGIFTKVRPLPWEAFIQRCGAAPRVKAAYTRAYVRLLERGTTCYSKLTLKMMRSFTSRKSFTKQENLNYRNPYGSLEKAPRLIQGCSEEMAAILGPWMLAVQEHVCAWFKKQDKTLFAAGWSTLEVAQFLDFQRYTTILENDVSAWDTSLREPHLAVECSFFLRFHPPRAVSQILHATYSWTRGCTSRGIQYALTNQYRAMRFSGDFQTAMGNSILNILIHCRGFCVIYGRTAEQIVDLIHMIAMGDDNVTSSKLPPRDGFVQFFADFGMKTDVTWRRNPESAQFCSMRFMPCEEGWNLVPKTGKLLAKIGYTTDPPILQASPDQLVAGNALSMLPATTCSPPLQAYFKHELDRVGNAVPWYKREETWRLKTVRATPNSDTWGVFCRQYAWGDVLQDSFEQELRLGKPGEAYAHLCLVDSDGPVPFRPGL